MTTESPSSLQQEIENRTQELGKFLWNQLERRRPSVLDSRWWEDKLLNQITNNESIKAQLFRFVDVLPMLKSHTSVNQHLHEYFEEVRAHLPWAIKLGLDFSDHNPVLSRVLSYSARANTRRMATKFIAGSNSEEVLQTVKRIRDQGFAFSLDLLGEAVITEAEANAYHETYLDIMKDMSSEVERWVESPQVDCDHYGHIPRMNLSIKLSALDSMFSPYDPKGTMKRVGAKLRSILDQAIDCNAFINIDMEQYEYKSLTYRMFKDILLEPAYKEWPHVGIVCQGYLKDSADDLKALRKWVDKRGTPISIRLVKGAYWDYETINCRQRGWPIPVYEQKWQTDENFEQLTAYLLEHHQALKPAFASHNLRSMARAMAISEIKQIPQDAYEMQMLFGMSGAMAQIFADEGIRTRIYMPFGELIPGMSYLVRRLLENTSNESFLKHAYAHDLNQEELFINPTVKGLNMPPVSPPKPLAFENEPHTDFSQEKSRKLMTDSLKNVRDMLGETYPVLIGGKSYETRNTLTSKNPSKKSETIGKVCLANEELTLKAIEAARDAFPEWAAVTVDYRAEYLELIASQIRERKYELCAWIVLETGKQWWEADADVAEAIDFCNYYAQEMRRLSDPREVHLPGEENDYIYRPRGVCVVIAPWNFPLAILTGMAAAAIVAGNTVVIKPAEQSSVVAAKFMEIIRDAHIPNGVVNYLPGIGEEIGPALVSHPDVSLVAFTGSKEVGLEINNKATETHEDQHVVKKVIAELGGKNAIIIDEDADLDEAVTGVIHSAFGYSGQKCSACSRVVVVGDIYDQFLERLKGATEAYTVGPSEDPGNKMGPVIDADALARIENYIEIAQEEGQPLLEIDCTSLQKKGFFVGPHIYTEVAPDARIAQEEIFGPVLAVIKAQDFTEALKIANQTKFALTGGVYSRSPENLKRARQDFQVGNLYLNRNCTGALVFRQPFGGFKMSGIGSKAGGPDYLLQFLIPINITENTMRRGFALPDEDADSQPEGA